MRFLTSIVSSIILIDCRVKALNLFKTYSALLLNPSNKTHRFISSNLSSHRYRSNMSTFVSTETKNDDVISPETQRSNPLLQSWSTNPFGLPPFTSTIPSDFEYALEYSMKQHLDELSAIASNPEPPTFENTIAPFDRSGRLFYRVNNMFDNLCSSNSPPELQAVELKMASPLASHYNKISSLPGLFDRINTIYESRLTSEYTAEQLRLIERFHLDFVRSGAKFSVDDQKRYAAITEKLAELCTIFTQNVLTDESEITLDLKETSNDLLGLPSDLIACAKQAAIERNKPDDTYVITLSRSLVEPFITFSERADLREKAWKLWTKRGELDSKRDNLAVAKQILQLRVQQAGMHGYKVSE